jgi:hypothetical protein
MTGANVNGNLLVFALFGDDQVAIAGGEIGGSIGIYLGPGDNVVDLDGVTVARHVAIVTNFGADTVVIADAQIGGNVLISTGLGNDVVVIRGTTNIAERATVYLGAGDDRLGVLGAQVGELRVYGEPGSLEAVIQDATVAGDVRVYGGIHDDQVFLEGDTTVAGSVAVNAGFGNNTIRVSGATLASSLRIDAYSGADVVVVQDTQIDGSATINTGFGADRVFIQSTSVDGSAAIHAGAGNDRLLLEATLDVQGQLTVDGGSGVDSIARAAFDLISAGSKVLRSVENQVVDLVAGDLDFINGLVDDLAADLEAIGV